ncbi:MAG TPA: MFS transporter [Candidatus Limnocylindria bacterium]|nr:MFS transporter [Candidatus Limnocylindria bacterium]
MTRTLVVVSLVSFMQDAASELVYPLLPLLLTGALAAPPVVVGFVEGAATGVAALVAYVSGRRSDVVGRKPLVFTGYSLAAVGKVIVAAAWAWPVVLVGRVVDRMGKGIRGAPRDALIGESVPPEALGRAFGFHRAMDTAGAVIGPLIALGALTLLDDDLRQVLWLAVIPAVASALLVLLIREPARVHVTASAEAKVTDLVAHVPAPPRAPLSPELRRVLAMLTAFALVNFPDVLVLLRLSDIGWTTSEVVGGYALYNLAYTAVSFPAGHLSDRMSRAQVYALGLVFFAIGYLGLGLLDSGPLVLVVLVLYGGFNGCTDGVGKAWISSLAPTEQRGRAQGAYQGFSGGAILIAGIWAGLLWNVGPGGGVVPLLISGSVAVVFAVVFATYGRRLG